MIEYKNGRLVDDLEYKINKENENGYAVAEHDYPHDTDIYYAEDYEEAEQTIRLILKDFPNRKVYIREITDEEANRYVNMMVAAEMGYY